MAFPAKKASFMDDVVNSMGDDEGNTKYGADMEDQQDGGDDESQEDQAMAARQVAKALGLPNVDNAKLAAALKAFVSCC